MREDLQPEESGFAAEKDAPQEPLTPVGAPAAEAEESASPGEEEKPTPPPVKRNKKKKKKGKKRRNGAGIALLLILVVLVLVFGVFVGYGLGRNRRARQDNPADAQPPAEALNPAGEEELSEQNQEALDALAGLDSIDDSGLAALSGEDFFPEEEELAAEPVVVAEYGDGQTLLSDEVLEVYDEELSTLIFAGYSEEEVAEELLDRVLRDMVSERLQEQHARELGLDALTEADQAEIDAEAQEEYDSYVTFYRDNVIEAEGLSAEEAEEAAKTTLLEEEGISLESLRSQLAEDHWKEKLYEACVADVTVDDADVRAAYDERLARQKAALAESPEDYEFDQANGEIMLCNPAGLRAVKFLLLGFADEGAAADVLTLSDPYSSSSLSEEERQQQLDACYAEPEARARQALQELRGGADMDEMIRSIGSDVGMMDDRQRETGYYISADSTLWAPDIVSAAMALQSVGDYSEPIRCEDGVCILQYIGDVPEGDVPYEGVREALTEEVLEEARGAAYDAQLAAWLEEANPQYYPERLQ